MSQAPSLSAVLADLRRRFAPAYGDALTNHMPMAAVALHRLGPAWALRVAALVEAHAARLAPAAPSPPAEALAALLGARGVDAVLRERLQGPRGLPGVAGAAFHGAIRAAFAVMSKDVDELAHALAYLEDTALPLEDAGGAAGRETDLAALAERLRGMDKPSGPNITVRMRAVAATPRFREVAADLAVDGSTLRQVSGLGARWYLAADDFASLHVLTGAHAVRTLRPWTVDERAADRALALAALACFVVSGCPARADARARERAEDKELKAAAIASDDDHMAKLVVAALDEEAAHEDQIYRIVATRAARRGHT